MDQEPDVIRHNIEQTRSALTDKLETLESQVRGTVENARERVEETIHTVRSTVNDTVDSIKESLDIRQHVRRHPWVMLGGSIATGFVVGSYLERALNGHGVSSQARKMGAVREDGRERSAALPAAAPVPPGPPAQPSRGLFSRLLHEFDDEIEQVKQMAIGASMGLLREYLKKNLPQFEQQIAEVVDSATQKMGGRPLEPGFMEQEPFGGESLRAGSRMAR
jgi:ElaB/YqjD/DUF883 family membrane-anchored ribosome-binding protein